MRFIVNMYILLTIFYTFLIILVRRLCLNIQIFLSFGDHFLYANDLTCMLSNDPGKVESNFFCYAAMCFPHPHRNVLIFTQRMHKPTERPFTR